MCVAFYHLIACMSAYNYIRFRCDQHSLIIASWLSRGKYYKMATKVELDKFLATPNSFVSPNAPRHLPAEELLPKKKSCGDVRALFPKQIELQCFCPVAYVDGNYRYNKVWCNREIQFTMIHAAMKAWFLVIQNLLLCTKESYFVFLLKRIKKSLWGSWVLALWWYSTATL